MAALNVGAPVPPHRPKFAVENIPMQEPVVPPVGMLVALKAVIRPLSKTGLVSSDPGVVVVDGA